MPCGPRDGMLVGTSPGIGHNDFLATDKSFGDFRLKLTFRLIGSDSSNSGVQFRSVRVPGHEMSGYQADIGQNYWGCLYDESRRNKVLVQASEDAVKTLHKSDWNEYSIRAAGPKITLALNGTTSVEYTEEDAKIADDGRIAVQIHAGGPMQIQFKDIYIQPLPRPTADDLDKPGFHTRIFKAAQGDRKYVVFVPRGYDGTKTFPVVLFLHGSGQRGTDGLGGVQGGLAPAIAARPDDYPFLGVFPQAMETWTADSDDAKAALAGAGRGPGGLQGGPAAGGPDGTLDGRQRKLVDRRRSSASFRRGRPHLRPAARRRPHPYVQAQLPPVVPGRRRCRRRQYGIEHPGDGCRHPRRRGAGQTYRVSRRRP